MSLAEYIKIFSFEPIKRSLDMSFIWMTSFPFHHMSHDLEEKYDEVIKDPVVTLHENLDIEDSMKFMHSILLWKKHLMMMMYMRSF